MKARHIFNQPKGVSADPLRTLLLCLLTVFLFTVAPTRALADGGGIGGYDLKSSADLAIAYDYNGTGKADHLLLYRPGTGIVWILANQNGVFSPVYASEGGIGGYDLRSPGDRIVAVDYGSTGNHNELLCYRPGTGVVWILANNNGAFSAVFQSTHGIGGYDLTSPNDQLVAVNIGSGNNKDLLAYRPGSGIFWAMVGTSSGSYFPEFESSSGIGSFDLKSATDKIFAFGFSNLFMAYRPGTGIVEEGVVRQNTSGQYVYSSEYFSTIDSVTGFGNGYAGYDFRSSYDQLTELDYYGNGQPETFVAYRPGSGIAWGLGPLYSLPVLFASSYNVQTGFGSGIGGYDLRSTADLIIPFDYQSSGLIDHLVAYRPGSGIVFILKNTNGVFSPVYTSPYVP